MTESGNKKPEMVRQPPITAPVVTDWGDGIYNILMPIRFNTYLVLGEERALLIDTGMGVGSLKSVVETITDLPVQVLNTHGHPDHAGGNSEFGPAMISPADKATAGKMANLEFRKVDLARTLNGKHPELIEKLLPDSGAPFILLEDGEVIDIGNRRLTVYFTPGHSPGSVCVYDEKTGTLFGGDTIQPNIGLSTKDGATLRELLAGLKKIAQLNITRIMYGHDMPVSVQDGRALIDNAIAALEGAINGTLPYTEAGGMWQKSRLYSVGGVGVSIPT